MTRGFQPGRALRPGFFILLLAGAVLAGAALAEPLDPAAAARKAAVLAPPDRFDAPESFEGRPGGATTSFAAPDRNALRRPFANLGAAASMDFALGEAIFEKFWVPAPASTKSSDGLGPVYDMRSCHGCHMRSARGRGETGMSVRLFPPDPLYGAQLQRRSAPGAPVEGRLEIDWARSEAVLGDGARVELRRPVAHLRDLAQGPLAARTRISLRMAPPLIGLGLLEAIPEADIRAAADPDDADGDGVSGRARDRGGRLGRFGLRAGAVSVQAQSAEAFSLDMGLSSRAHPAPSGDCVAAQRACLAAPHGDDGAFEVGDDLLRLTSLYAASLAPPARRDVGDPQVLRGKALFHAAGCAACHQPKFVTARRRDDPARSFQLIWPYTDLLLHDMGEGLADAAAEPGVSGREWRTAPLWGLGLAQRVAPGAGYLHDGRARSLIEAVLWHGGEAESARETIRLAPLSDRTALIAFLESL